MSEIQASVSSELRFQGKRGLPHPAGSRQPIRGVILRPSAGSGRQGLGQQAQPHAGQTAQRSREQKS